MWSNFLDFVFNHTPVFYFIQSVWRDEAFSYFMAKPDIFQVIVNTAHDFNPPLYYLVLHFWMKFVGLSDTGLRLISFIPHLVSVFIAYCLGKKLTSGKFAYFIAIFTLLNPMLLYYAFEMRMYSLFALFTICSLYFLLMKNWKWYIITTTLGLYTHSFFPLIIVVYLLYFLKSPRMRKKNIFRVMAPFIFYLPWLPILANQFLNSKNSWIYPVDFQLIKSVLGNLFTSYEGTPGNLWAHTAILSGCILFFLILAFRRRKKEIYLILSLIFLPLLLILSYSILKRSIYVNRYLIFITVYEILGISFGIYTLKNRMLRWSIMSIWLFYIVYLNLFLSPYHAKTDFKSTFIEINKVARSEDYVYSETPLSFLESAYYYKFPNRAFIYNPDNISIPYYIGISVVFSDVSKTTLPQVYSKTFFIKDNAEYEVRVAI